MTRTSGLWRQIGGLLGVGTALLAGGCAGGGMVLGPNPQSSVSPTGSPQASAPAGQAASHSPTPSPHSLSGVVSWSQPTGLPRTTPAATLAALTSQPASLLIVDPATFAPDLKGALPAALHQNGHKTVLALIDIGEIVKTNPLWQSVWVDDRGRPTPAAPAWLAPASAEAPDASPVLYWNPAWQKLTEVALDRIIAQGYDGVCLRGVGAFAPFLKSRPTAGAEMAAFVEALAARARKTDPAFIVLPDGGARLPASLTAAQGQAYLHTVDGVVAHDVFYPGDKSADNPLAPNETLVAALDVFRRAGRPVFVTERLTDTAKIADFLARAHSKGYVPDDALAEPSAPSLPPAPAPPVSAQVADVRG